MGRKVMILEYFGNIWNRASLERSIRKGIRSSSIDKNTSSSIDSRQPPSTPTPISSTNTFHPISIDTSVRISIDTEPRDMVATLILVRDERGYLHDQEGHLRNAPSQRIYAQGAEIPEPDTDATGTTLPVDEAAQTRTLADYNRQDQFYTNRSAILPPTIQRGNFELKPQYYTLKAVPPTETGITRRAVADLQAQIENLTAAVAALSTQQANSVIRHERNNQTAIDDEFEEDKNPLSRLRDQPPIRNNNNNDSYFDNKYENFDTKVYDTRDNENSYFVQLGDPIFDVSDKEE
ncbi:hypothetical protein DY000_02048298 [Brassica cretica]|uniref:Uncharacterized protein n=1 Tax=Brassica cretica TaxID=69181 RepID=A0ABQ7EPB5_BRACR|nr:hypothetical protein DY000_02048298 [Brassica cretica]